jgi:hypothetical protein
MKMCPTRGPLRRLPVGAVAALCLTAVVTTTSTPAQAAAPAATSAGQSTAGPTDGTDVVYVGGGRKMLPIRGGCQVATVKIADLKTKDAAADAKAQDAALHEVPLAIRQEFAGLPLATDPTTGRKAQDPMGAFNTADNVTLAGVTSQALKPGPGGDPRIRLVVKQNVSGVSCREVDAALKAVPRRLLSAEGAGKKPSPGDAAVGEIAATSIVVGAVLLAAAAGAALVPLGGAYVAGTAAFVGGCIGGFLGRWVGARQQGLDTKGALSAAGVSARPLGCSACSWGRARSG